MIIFMAPSSGNKKNKRFFVFTILTWFDQNGRNFKWRNERDPYRILIAEIMLQRTKASQVEPVYSKFIGKFRNLGTLADSKVEEIDQVIKVLGLSRRSRLFVEMAGYVSRIHDGFIPSSRKDLLLVPGIGDYIADAMILFAFGGKRIAVDTNVVRLVSRFYGMTAKGEGRRDRILLEFCESLAQELDPDTLKKLNWALIDFPALVCKTKPLCYGCPLAKNCAYFKKEINSVRIMN